jgi:hypothetical protein
MKLFLAVGQLLLYAQLTIGYSFTITDFTNNYQISKNVNGINEVIHSVIHANIQLLIYHFD